MKPKLHLFGGFIFIILLLTACTDQAGGGQDSGAPPPQPDAALTENQQAEQPFAAAEDGIPPATAETPLLADPYAAAAYDPATPLLSHELSYGGVRLLQTTPAEVEALFGVPLSREMWGDDYYADYPAYADVEFYFVETSQGVVVDSMLIMERTELATPRGIRVGDTLTELLARLPQERDYRTDPDGYFYGEPPADHFERLMGPSGAVLDEGFLIWVTLMVDYCMVRYLFVDELVSGIYIYAPL